MKTKVKMLLAELEKELILLNESEKHNTLGGQSTTTTVDDVYQKILNGDFTDIPPGRYDFNTGEFTPYDPSMQDADWYVAIETVTVTAYQYEPSPYGYDYPYPVSPVSSNYFQDILFERSVRLDGPGGGSGGSGGGGGGSPFSGVYYITGQSSAGSIGLSLPPYITNPDYGGYNSGYEGGYYWGYSTEAEGLNWLAEHYGGQPEMFYKYVFGSELMSPFTGTATDTVAQQIFDPNAVNSNVSAETIWGAINNMLDKIDQFYEDFMISMGQLQIDLTGFGVIGTGQALSKLETGFEQELFKKYWEGDGSDYELSSSDYMRLYTDYIASDLPKYDSETVKSIERKFPDNNGNIYYISHMDGYALGNKYDFSLGGFTGIFDATGGLVGVFDKYDFNPAERSGLAEFATRAVNAVSHWGVAEYHITGGYVPIEVYEQIKAAETNPL